MANFGRFCIICYTLSKFVNKFVTILRCFHHCINVRLTWLK